MSEPIGPDMRAAESADIPVMQLLLDKGADPKAVTKAGVTALMVAAGMGHKPTYRRQNSPSKR